MAGFELDDPPTGPTNPVPDPSPTASATAKSGSARPADAGSFNALLKLLHRFTDLNRLVFVSFQCAQLLSRRMAR